MPRARVTMFHPEAGVLECPEGAVRIWRRKGWDTVTGAVRITLTSAGGDPLTTATVFEPETFDDDPVDVDLDT